MISRIRGVILEKQIQEVVIDVHGLAYEVQVPLNTALQLPGPGNEASLYTHFIVREDAQLLYGFSEARERELFRILIRINGVGPKLALTILSGMETSNFVLCVQNNDVNALVKLPGVGKKTAERLLVEVRDKFDAPQTDGDSTAVNGHNGHHGEMRDAETALQSLGYKPVEASRAVTSAMRQLEEAGRDIASAELIRVALRGML